MKTTFILIIFALAWITWFVTALWLQDHRQTLALVHADFPMCVTAHPGPLHPSRKPVFYPRNSDLS
jgi:hypothetical protein